MSKDLVSVANNYQASKIELWEGKKILFSSSGVGGDLGLQIQTLGIQQLLGYVRSKQHLVLVGKNESCTIFNQGHQYKVCVDRTDIEQWNIFLPMYTPLVLADVSLEKTTEPDLVEEPLKEVQKKSQFGSRFAKKFGVQDSYVAGAMAGGIASVDLVRAMSKHGRLAFFGAGGVPNSSVRTALESLSTLDTPFGCNVLCNVQQPQQEEELIDILLEQRVQLISASAYSTLTPALVRYRLKGISESSDGSIVIPNQVFAKVSHPSVAKLFVSPPPQKIVDYLYNEGKISSKEAELASKISMADALTVEADSGGHTDNRPLSVILPSIKRLVRQSSFSLFVGAAGGLGTPESMASAAILGADYLVLGSIHQSCVEAGTSDLVKQMLCRAKITDTDMGVAPDMFERGSKVQVLTSGSLYAARSRKLRELYVRYSAVEDIPQSEQKKISRLIFRDSLENIWKETEAYWNTTDPKQLDRARRVPKHKLALLFRWYLGQSSRWARMGVVERKQDFQIWCGPAMGAFNEWATDNGFSSAEKRLIAPISDALWNQFISLL